ncbi:hypothetical protein CN639_04055 [Bacillus toyonensis]|uniref:Uncharacterized protein n=2 Tax=Bacillus toyonensis TaxID=155322 RepID=A0AB36SWP5_9BACI|nr:hypothetical protein CON55_12490 [Bacillus toyonensis]PED93904.1 hypothetical protein CON90_15275 [Bacillus toyonensis]PEJ61896.1 hypothetical protein CN906_23160 [Bacillus toyonensis]PEL52288.1 hypothetical protein CN633_30725 [Bacillus toyonensis]PEM93889.1 hypothetical protein CN639_04055 [Bacillus toyonensis]
MRVIHSLLAILAVIFLICGVIIHEYVLVFLVGICCMVIVSFMISSIRNWKVNRKRISIVYFSCVLILLLLTIYLLVVTFYTRSLEF